MKKEPENYKTKKKSRNAVINNGNGPSDLSGAPSSNFISRSTVAIIDNSGDATKECENITSPTKKMINMFEGLVNTDLMGKKPFFEETSNDIEEEKDEAETLKKKQEETGLEIENEENSTDVTVESLKERIKEILNIPILNESNEYELEADDIDRMHEENMKALKLKLQLTDQDSIDSGVKKSENESIFKSMEPEIKKVAKVEKVSIEGFKSISTTVKETVMKSIPVNKSTENSGQSVPKCNVEEARKIFTRNAQKERESKKNIVQCNVNDLTGEVFHVSIPMQATPLLTSVQSDVAIIGNNEMDSKYNMEREIIEMVKKIKEIQSVDEIQVEYVESASKKPRSSIFGKVFGCFSCGMC
ncbi:hypothetical protein GINT2_000407 [Glugoides intestinalis]